ncbi:tRNA pseudouridine synthase [Psidium guajava]|nr:tRNA pseudouridine synthase [Psidium guajava]
MTGNLQSARDRAFESSERPSKIAKSECSGDEGEAEEESQQPPELGIASRPMNQNPRVQRYLIAIEYIGTRFSGSQKQPNCRTVVGVLEEAFHKFIGQPVSVFCSSRTDAGVHALSNVCHVDVERISKRKPGAVLEPHEPQVVRRAVNHFLQKSEGDISVIDVRCVPADFHARYRACERTYFYRLFSGPEPLSTFEKERAWHVTEELNLVSMEEACKVLIGEHDFSSFRASGCQANSPIRTLDKLNVSEVVSSPYFPSMVERRVESMNGVTDLGFGMRKKHRCLVVTARARSFLYHQVGFM